FCTSSFSQVKMVFFQSNAMKQLKKVLKERGLEDSEGHKFIDKAVKHLSKRCIKSMMMENLSVAVNTKSKTSPCVLVHRCDKNRSNTMDRGNTHLLSCRIFRFGWLQSVNDLKSTPNCSNPYTKRAEIYCINPYHYDPPKATKIRPMTVQRDRFPFPTNGFEEIPEDDYIPNHTLSPDNPLIVRKSERDDEEMGSPESNFSEDVDMEDVTEITEDPKRPGLFTVPFEETSCWLKLSYGEGDKVRTHINEVHGHEYTIDSSTNPSDSERLCVGYFTGMETVRDKKLEEIRRAIGRGVRLYHSGGEVYIECLSDHPIFVQCPAANRRYGMAASSVVRVEPKTTLKIFNYSEFSNELAQAVERGFEPVYSLIKLCSIRVSFVKGWGHEYSRSRLDQTGCWFIANFPAPALWIEKVIQKMGAPPLFCGSVT
ncbi:hypothetical protein PMAYCL1PPCAC_23768, partial [Pristionchus mayeri]